MKGDKNILQGQKMMTTEEIFPLDSNRKLIMFKIK